MYDKLSIGIAKLIGQIWFGASPAIQLVFDEAVGVASPGLTSGLEKRKAERFFADCADTVVERSADFLKVEFSRLESDRVAILIEDIASRFESFKLSKQFIASNYSEVYLTDWILDSLTLVDKDSTEELLLCKAVVTQIAFYVCEYVHLAPEFLPKTVGQILDNQDEIRSILKTILENSVAGAEDVDLFEVESASYVSRMKKYVSFIQVFGLSTHSIKKKYKLEASYISLTATDTFLDGTQIGGLPIEEAFDGPGPFLVEGPAGSGKSTLLQWIALSCCDQHLNGRISAFDGLIPVFIRLRSLPSMRLKKLSILEAARLSNPDLFTGVDEKWFIDRIETAGAVLLIDGMDEVPSDERNRIINWIDALPNHAPDCPILITTRPTNEKLPFQHTLKATFLENMSFVDVDKFITYWHRAVGSGLVDEGLLNSLDQSRARLLSALRALSELRTLATNPLMCAILCTINLDRNCNIPREKSEIYTVVIELLLNRRDKERDIEGFAISSLPPKSRRAVLQECARWLTLNENTEIERQKFIELVDGQLNPSSEEECRLLANSFIDRSGLLRQVSSNSVEFIHKQFQEHLAAESFVQEDDIGLLENMIGKASWKEIFPAAAGLMNKSQATRMIAAMIEFSEGQPEHIKRSGFFQVVVCGELARKLEDSLATKVLEIQSSIFPPSSVEEVYQLLPLGDRLKQLVKNSNTANFSDSSIALCLKALIETGGVDVIPVIGALRDLAGPESIAQLIRGWTYFDPETYGKEVISSIKEPYTLVWNGVVNIKGLHNAEHANRLEFSDCLFTDNLSSLPKAVDCTNLEITGSDFLRSTAGIERLTGLKKIRFGACRELSCLNGISKLTHLRSLEILDCHELSDIGGLAEMNRLEELILVGCHDICDITSVGKMRKLRRLVLDGSYGITNWRPLLLAPNLTEVQCSETAWLDEMDDEFMDRVMVH